MSPEVLFNLNCGVFGLFPTPLRMSGGVTEGVRLTLSPHAVPPVWAIRRRRRGTLIFSAVDQLFPISARMFLGGGPALPAIPFQLSVPLSVVRCWPRSVWYDARSDGVMPSRPPAAYGCCPSKMAADAAGMFSLRLH